MIEETKVASREEVEKWHEEDYWQKLDFSPTWIFIIPSAMIVCVLFSALFIGSVLIPAAW